MNDHYKGYAIHQWTGDQVEKFWNYESNFPEKFWASTCWRTLFKYFKKQIKNSKNILDLGCGGGALIQKLLETLRPAKQQRIYGLDLSKEAVAKANLSFNRSPCFGGAFDSIDSLKTNSQALFDLIFCTEVVEHLYDNELNILIETAKSLLSPSGILIITTPNNEKLENSYICNPIDNTLFHRQQHVRSLTAKSLSGYLQTKGFHVRRALEINALWSNTGNPLKRLYRRLRCRERTNLLIECELRNPN